MQLFFDFSLNDFSVPITKFMTDQVKQQENWNEGKKNQKLRASSRD